MAASRLVTSAVGSLTLRPCLDHRWSNNNVSQVESKWALPGSLRENRSSAVSGKSFLLFPCFLSVCPQVFGLLLWIVCWTDLFYTFHELRQGHSQPPIYFVTPLVLGMTMVRMRCAKERLQRSWSLDKKTDSACAPGGPVIFISSFIRSYIHVYGKWKHTRPYSQWSSINSTRGTRTAYFWCREHTEERGSLFITFVVALVYLRRIKLCSARCCPP